LLLANDFFHPHNTTFSPKTEIKGALLVWWCRNRNNIKEPINSEMFMHGISGGGSGIEFEDLSKRSKWG